MQTIGILKHALMIGGFVFIMMLLVDYLNVLSKGDWQERLKNHRFTQYILSSLLGVIPGCLGAFAVVSLYVHRVVTAGALVATMIATSGDEAFVMLAMFPDKAMLVFGILFLIALPTGMIVDGFSKRGDVSKSISPHAKLELHPEELRKCNCYPNGQILEQWRHCSPHRGLLTFFLAIFLLGVLAGEIGPPEWNWVRGTLAATSAIGLFIVSTVPDHFLEEHLWNHIVKKHILRIFLWTLGALVVMHVLIEPLQLDGVIKDSKFIILVIACLVGIIPESGPHLIFVTFYSQGLIPFSILLASCVVQDGHAMLPVLAHSRKTFLWVKAINVAIGFAVGLLGYFVGW